MKRRTPEQIIGHDAVMQLIFEGYEIREITERTKEQMKDISHLRNKLINRKEQTK